MPEARAPIDPAEPDASSTPDAAHDAQSASDPPDAEPESSLGCQAHAGAILCEDFETGAIDSAIWTTKITGDAEIDVALMDAREGQHALRVLVPAAENTGAFIRTTQPFPVANNHFFGRVWLRMGPAVPEKHSYVIAATGTLGSATAAYRLDSNGGELNSRYVHAPTVTEHGGLKKFGYDMPAAEWLCVEWEYDGSNDEMRYWMNGDAVPGMTVTAAEEPPWVAPPEFTRLEIGWLTYQAPTKASEFELLVDALVLDTERIGCGQ